MNFVKKIKTLTEAYDNTKCAIKDQAFLCGLCEQPPPLAEHIIYQPMPARVMQKMLDNYKRKFPEQLLQLYAAMNGANLFYTIFLFGEKKIRIPICGLSLYGIPLFGDREHIEPFNISIEDLRRPIGTPKEWLKFGSYYKPENLSKRLDLFVGVEQGGVFAVECDTKECCAVKTWASIDACLCDIFDLWGRAYGSVVSFSEAHKE